MNQLMTIIEKITVFLNGLLILLLGPLNIQLSCIVILLICDLVLGVMASKKNKTFDKKYFRAKTIEKTIIYLIWVVIGHTFDIIVSLPDIFRGIIILIMASHELTSALKNTKELGYNLLARTIEKRVCPLINKEKDERGLKQ